MPFLPPNQQRQRTEGGTIWDNKLVQKHIQSYNTGLRHHWFDVQEAQLSPSDRAMRLFSNNLANCHATVEKLLIQQVLTKLMV